MSARLRDIARTTVAIAEAGRYRTGSGKEVDIADAVRAAVAETRLYTSDTSAGFDPSPVTAAVEVTYESTLMAARRVGPGAATLVFASVRT